MATPAEIRELADTAAADPKSATSDGQSATAQDPLVLEQLADRRAAQAAVTGSNENGGRKSAIRGLAFATAIPPGAV